MDLYLSPSVQTWNLDVFGVSESTTMNFIADAMEPLLKNNDITYKRNNLNQTLAQIVAESNAGDFKLHLAMHSNATPPESAGTVRGSRAYYYATSTTGRNAASIFVKNMKQIYPLTNLVQMFPSTDLYELNHTKAPAVLMEAAFHDNYEDATWINNNIQNIARIYTMSVSEFLGKTYKEICSYGTVPATSFTYTGLMYGKICNAPVVNVRAAPGTSSTVLMQLPVNTQVVILSGNSGGWVKIRYNSREGFVSGSYLCICETSPSVVPPAISCQTGVVSTAGSALNVRSAASATASIVGTLPNSSPLIILGETGNFYRIYSNGLYGFASKDYIRRT